jgi:6-phosphogluconate dehydrogenase
MDIAILGLGRMGGNMARRLLRGGHRVIMWNRTTETAEKIMAEAGAGGVVRNVADLREMLAAPRRAWMMLPAGQTTQDMLEQLMDVLEPGDTIVDGGNSNYKDVIALARSAKGKDNDGYRAEFIRLVETAQLLSKGSTSSCIRQEGKHRAKTCRISMTSQMVGKMPSFC